MRARSLERGQILPLVALCLAVLMGFSAMAVDVGFLEYRQRQQQSAADAAAIGGAQQLAYAGCNNPSAAQTAGLADAATNGFPDESTNSGPITVTITNPPSTGAYAGNNCAVQATINNKQTQTFFSRLFGYASGMQETTQAVAASVSNANGCAYLLGVNATPDFHGAKISAAGCGLLINGSPTFDGGEIDFANIGYAGSLTTHGTKWDDAQPTPMLPVADPCPEIAGCRYLTANPPSNTSGCGTATASNGVINPGCYSGISGSVTTMNPGMYVFTGNGTISLNGTTVTGNGVTIYAAGSTSIDFHGVTANLTACTTSCGGSSPYQAVPNVLYFQPPSNSSQMIFAGPQSTYSGLIYAPSASVTYDGNAGTGYTVLVFDDWVLNGTGQGMTFSAPPQTGGILPQAVLVQ